MLVDMLLPLSMSMIKNWWCFTGTIFLTRV